MSESFDLYTHPAAAQQAQHNTAADNVDVQRKLKKALENVGQDDMTIAVDIVNLFLDSLVDTQNNVNKEWVLVAQKITFGVFCDNQPLFVVTVSGIRAVSLVSMTNVCEHSNVSDIEFESITDQPCFLAKIFIIKAGVNKADKRKIYLPRNVVSLYPNMDGLRGSEAFVEKAKEVIHLVENMNAEKWRLSWESGTFKDGTMMFLGAGPIMSMSMSFYTFMVRVSGVVTNVILSSVSWPSTEIKCIKMQVMCDPSLATTKTAATTKKTAVDTTTTKHKISMNGVHHTRNTHIQKPKKSGLFSWLFNGKANNSDREEDDEEDD